MPVVSLSLENSSKPCRLQKQRQMFLEAMRTERQHLSKSRTTCVAPDLFPASDKAGKAQGATCVRTEHVDLLWRSGEPFLLAYL